MLNVLPALLTACTVLLHTVLGCCWHAHRDEHGELATHAHEFRGCHQHAHDSPTPHDDEPCEHGRCSFWIAKPAELNRVSAKSTWDLSAFVALAALQSDPALSVPTEGWTFRGGPAVLREDAARVRARLQIWIV